MVIDMHSRCKFGQILAVVAQVCWILTCDVVLQICKAEKSKKAKEDKAEKGSHGLVVLILLHAAIALQPSVCRIPELLGLLIVHVHPCSWAIANAVKLQSWCAGQRHPYRLLL